MEFQLLNVIDKLATIDKQSNNKLQAIFKHSTRCSVSLFANKILKKELEDINNNAIDVYYLDLITYRSISNEIAERYGIRHESPQILIIKNGKCVYDASHSDVSLKTALMNINDNKK